MTRMSRAVVTIGLPVYNGERYVEAALRSLMDQTFDDVRIDIADNASTDRTGEICRDLASSDERISYVRHAENIGANRNFNWLASRNTSPFFRWAAADDELSPDALASLVGALDQDRSAVLAYTRTVLIDAAGQAVREQVDDGGRASSPDPIERFVDVLRNEVWCLMVFGLIRADALAKTRLLRPFYGADRVFLSELALAGRFVNVDGPTFRRRCHDEQSTAMSIGDKARWTRGSDGRWTLPAPVAATMGFADAVGRTRLPAGAKARGLSAVAGHTARRLDRLWRPGPFNYLGWRGGRGVDASSHLDLRPELDIEDRR